MDDGEHVPATGGARQGLDDEDLRLLSLVATGLPTVVVARTLNTSPRTLQRRIREICDRIGVNTTVEAVAWAARRQLI